MKLIIGLSGSSTKTSLLALPLCLVGINCTTLTEEKAEGQEMTRSVELASSQEKIVYPTAATAIIDVTQPPYNADNSGKTDCTKALIRAYDDVLRPVLSGFQESLRAVEENPDTTLGFESSAARGVLFPDRTPPSRILYFPNGIYQVSNTIVYSFDNLKNTQGNEMNRQIHFQGQSQSGTIIQLQDRAPGFEQGANRPVISLMKGERSNVAMSNTVENLTIDVGTGNPGAVGLRYFANNTGAVRHLTIQSSDPEKAGHIGLSIDKEGVSGCYFKNVTVDGFDYGIQVVPVRIATVFEHIRLSDQKKAGFQIVDNIVSIRGLQSHNQVPALQVTGSRAHIVLLDSELKGENASGTAINVQNGFLFARNINTSGYLTALATKQETIPGGLVEEYSSAGMLSLFENGSLTSLQLPVEETPNVGQYDTAQWVSINAFGAKGDGQTDDTQAIQRAMNAGKPVVYFNPGQYVVDSTIIVPGHVKRIDLMYADLKAGERLKQMKEQGTFKIVDEPGDPLIIERLFAWEEYYGHQYLVDHASTRSLVLKDLHVQVGCVYKNSVAGGKVYIENVCSTNEIDRAQPCFSFIGQQVWARQLNPERTTPQVRNDGSVIWLMGFKTESNGVSFKVSNGGSFEILGGCINNYSPVIPDERPILINNESAVSFTAATNGRSEIGHFWRTIVRETQNGVTKTLDWQALPRRYENQSVIPLYVGD